MLYHSLHVDLDLRLDQHLYACLRVVFVYPPFWADIAAKHMHNLYIFCWLINSLDIDMVELTTPYQQM